jgi:4-amino-4-deoxy-L-arabinose transferase-like glycosyltransferase
VIGRLGHHLPMRAFGTGLVVWAALLAFGQTGVTGGDEDLHIVAAMQVAAGQRPYLDFFHQHPPLFTYVGAAWFWVVGAGWRSAHVLASLLTGAAVWLTMVMAVTQLENRSERSAGLVAILVGLHVTTLMTGTLGHPYALTLVFLVAAYGLALAARARPTWIQIAGTGLGSGAAAASTLLALPAIPIILAWLLRATEPSRRGRALAAFAAGAILPFVPVLVLAARDPRIVVFDLLWFHLSHRSVASGWTPSRAEWLLWNPHVLLETWLETPQSLLLVALALIGMAHRDKARPCPALSLAAWLAAGLGLYLACVVPTNGRYFIIILPFLGLLATDGINRILDGVPGARRQFVLATLLGLFVAGLVRPIYREFKPVPETAMTAQHYRWTHWELVGQEVNRVTSSGGGILAPPWVYVAAKRLPPDSLGNRYGVRLVATGVPVLTRHGQTFQVDTALAQGQFDTVVLHPQDSGFARIQADGLYSQHRKVLSYYVFWGSARVTR